tara:strand:- start:1190 stop:1786 length:597 start_codon:yes stop_codon:yes gene_type:complete
MNKKLLILPLVLALASGCSSMKYDTGFEFKAPEFGGGDQGDQVNYPDWYDKLEADDDNLHAVATEFSNDFQFAVDKAMLSAKRELASNFSSHVEAMMKDFTSELGDVDVSTANDINRTTKLVVSRVNLVGVQRSDFKVVHEKAGYRAFVKLKYNSSLSNKLILQQINRNKKLKAKLESTEKFKELEESVENINDGEIT